MGVYMERERAIIILENEQPHCGKKLMFSEEEKYDAFETAIDSLKQTNAVDVLQKLKCDMEQLRVDNNYVKIEDIVSLIDSQITSVSE